MTTASLESKLGPLAPLVGRWEGNVGLDRSFHYEDMHIGETTYFEKAWFKAIPTQTNGQQDLNGLTYQMTAWRHGEEQMDPFHDEVGYLLWDAERGWVMRSVVFGRGIAVLAGSEAKANDTTLHFNAEPGHPNWGIVQNPYLSERAALKGFKSSFTFNDDGSFSYKSSLILDLASLGKSMDHTDVNTLKKVSDKV